MENNPKQELNKVYEEINKDFNNQLMWGNSEESKYFTPNIEDIRVGYECEELWSTGEWIKGTLDSQDFWVIPDEIKAKGIRVPYLTKEQIEAEGWESVSPKFAASIEGLYHFRKGNYFTTYSSYRHTLSMILRDPSLEEQTGWELGFHPEFFRFFAECKDINTFRWICKLLKIS